MPDVGTMTSTSPVPTTGVMTSTPPPGVQLDASGIILSQLPITVGYHGTIYSVGCPCVRTIPFPFASSLAPPRPYVVPFRILPGYSTSFENDRAEVTHQVDVDWSLQPYFVSAMLGDALQDDQGRLRRYLPAFHWDWTWLPCVSCRAVEGVGVPDNVGGLVFRRRDERGQMVSGSYGFARYEVTFASTMYDLATDAVIDADGDGNKEMLRFVRRNANYGGEFFSMERIQMETEDTHEVIPGGFPFNFPNRQLELTWVDVPAVPEATIRTSLGKINSTIFDAVPGVGFNVPVEALLFLGAKREQRRTSTGRYLYSLTYSFSERLNGLSWNKSIKNNLELAYAQTRQTPHRRQYQQANLNDLFRLP